MQRIAAEVGFSETAFVAPLGGDMGGTWRIRYFSPESKVPSCGHATIALGATLAMAHGDGLLQFLVFAALGEGGSAEDVQGLLGAGKVSLLEAHLTEVLQRAEVLGVDGECSLVGALRRRKIGWLGAPRAEAHQVVPVSTRRAGGRLQRRDRLRPLLGGDVPSCRGIAVRGH